MGGEWHFRKYRHGAGRVKTIAQPLAVTDEPHASALQVRRGEICYEQVNFNYGRGRRVIDNLQLSIGAGEKIGLIGPSGAGKSTLVNLLLRLYDLNGGRIIIDAQDIAHVRPGESVCTNWPGHLGYFTVTSFNS